MTSEPLDIQKVALENALNVPKSFKNPNYKHTSRRVKALKQLMVDEQKYLKQLNLKPDALTYFTVEAPPSIKPVKRYCDITGLKGNYKSPTSGVRYHNAEVYTIVKNMGQGVDQQYLELRNANTVLR